MIPVLSSPLYRNKIASLAPQPGSSPTHHITSQQQQQHLVLELTIYEYYFFVIANYLVHHGHTAEVNTRMNGWMVRWMDGCLMSFVMLSFLHAFPSFIHIYVGSVNSYMIPNLHPLVPPRYHQLDN